MVTRLKFGEVLVFDVSLVSLFLQINPRASIPRRRRRMAPPTRALPTKAHTKILTRTKARIRTGATVAATRQRVAVAVAKRNRSISPNTNLIPRLGR